MGNLLDIAEDSTPNAIDGKIAKESFHHVYPRSAGWCEVDMEASVTSKPLLNFFMLMRGVVVADNMNLLVLWSVPENQVQEPQPLLMPMLLHAGANNFSIQDIHGGE